MKVLVELGASMEAKTDGGMTALHVATDKGQVAAVKLLVALGANKEAADDYMEGPRVE